MNACPILTGLVTIHNKHARALQPSDPIRPSLLTDLAVRAYEQSHAEAIELLNEARTLIGLPVLDHHTIYETRSILTDGQLAHFSCYKSTECPVYQAMDRVHDDIYRRETQVRHGSERLGNRPRKQTIGALRKHIHLLNDVRIQLGLPTRSPLTAYLAEDLDVRAYPA